MLGLIFIYFVGKAFYDLAGKHDKSQWGFAILGVVSYYGGLLVGALVIGIVLELNSPGYVDDSNDTFLGLLAIPLGLLTCWLTYTLLKKAWSKPKEISTNTLDSDLMTTNVPAEQKRYDQNER